MKACVFWPCFIIRESSCLWKENVFTDSLFLLVMMHSRNEMSQKHFLKLNLKCREKIASCFWPSFQDLERNAPHFIFDIINYFAQYWSLTSNFLKGLLQWLTTALKLSWGTHKSQKQNKGQHRNSRDLTQCHPTMSEDKSVQMAALKGGLKSLLSPRGLRHGSHLNGDNCGHFQTASPCRHLWCCTQKVTEREMRRVKQSLREVSTPPTGMPPHTWPIAAGGQWGFCIVTKIMGRGPPILMSDRSEKHLFLVLRLHTTFVVCGPNLR